MNQAPRHDPFAGSAVPPADLHAERDDLPAETYAGVRRAFGALLQPREDLDAGALVKRMVGIFGGEATRIDHDPRHLPGAAYRI